MKTQSMRKYASTLVSTYKNLTPKVRMRLKGGTAVVALAAAGLYATTQIFGATSDVSGIVYRDYNGNGRQDNVTAANPSLAADRGLGGVTVRGFGANSALCDTQTTDVTGAYTLRMSTCVGSKFRVEFTSLPAGYSSSQVGTDSKTTTQFVAPGGIASLGAYKPGDFCQNNPKLITSCILNGPYDGGESDTPSILGFSYNASGTSAPALKLGKHREVGATYGQVYRPASKSVYSSAFMKRHSDYGPAGGGAIYMSRVPASGNGTATSAVAVTIPNTGSNTHPKEENDCDSEDGQSSSANNDCWAHDQFSFDSPGKRSLGSMTLAPNYSNPAADALLVVNLNDRQVYKVTNLDATPSSTGYAMPLALPNSGTGALPGGSATGQHQACTANDVRPFSVVVYDSKGYAGFVCSAQTSRNTADLRAYIYSFNPDTMAFATAPMMEFPLNYERSCAYGDTPNCTGRATWIPWISQFTDPLIDTDVHTSSDWNTKSVVAPQPILSDIVFGDNGSLTIGLRDRYKDQLSYLGQSTNPNNSQRYTPETAGDTLRACWNGSIYVLESGGKCEGKGPGNSAVHTVDTRLPQGIGGNEFYSNEYYADTDGKVLHYDETSGGALAQIPGFDSFASTAKNPLDGDALSRYTGGIREYSSETGARTNALRVYQDEPGSGYLKANALGDINIICDTAPVEIGNRVWKDANGNGVQDSTEPGIAGVTVTLSNSANTVLATAQTDSDGNYLFSNRTLDENGQTVVSTTDKRYAVAGLTANTANFKLSLRNAADYTTATKLQGLHLTSANATANYGNDQNDSDASAADPAIDKLSATNPAGITFATGQPGANDHTYDFGFNQTGSIGNFVWLDSNKSGRVDGVEATQGINGVIVSLYGAGADTDNNGQLSTTELSAATAVATQATANDSRTGATNGRPGYYQFDGLTAGNYFVAIGATNFANGQPLQSLTEVAVPNGVGDTQDDNANHGAIPANGSLAANGVTSTRINLQAGAEPTSTSAKPDDDASSDTDVTIDFGFWHSYSLGNRVWLDQDNSATLNSADGTSPGVAGVKVRLLNSAGTTEINTTTTDNGGYYRFDNLNAGTYVVEVAASNFATGGKLHTHAISSIAAGEEIDPDLDGDNNDNGINPINRNQAVRSGTVTLGPGANEPAGETDLGNGGQGNTDVFANMTVDFGFIGTTSLGDTVYYDINGDMVQNPGEPGIPNVTVTLVCAGPDGNMATTADNRNETMKTDGNGNYLFTDLLPGACKATVTASDVVGATLTTPGSFTHVMVNEISFLEADFGFKGIGTIGNQVWKEVFNNGTYKLSEGDMPVAGVKVELHRDIDGNGILDNSDILIGTRTTDATGRYQFTNLPVDDNLSANGAGAQYVVKVIDPDDKLKNLQISVGPSPGADNNSQTPAGYGMVLTLAAPSNQTGDFGYHGLATVGDTVFYDTNNNGAQDTNESVLPGIKVTLTYPGPDGDCATNADNATRSMVTDANGNYLFTNLLGGKYCLSIEPPIGTTITTNNQGQQFSLGPTQIDLTRDFGVIGDGTIGNQVFIDRNQNGRFDGGDTGIAGVTIDLYRDLNTNGQADPGEPVIKTATTDGNGQYGFINLVTGDTNGIPYVVVVTDTARKLTNLTHVLGNGPADNESKTPVGYGISLTPTNNHRPEADFGYKLNPEVVEPPKFWKQQQVDRTTLVYTLTWINRSAVNALPTNFTDGIPDETSYVADSLQCRPEGSSVTTACTYNATLNRIEWSGKVGADVGHNLPSEAVNKVVVTFKVALNSTALEVRNQGFGRYDKLIGADIPSDWIDTPQLDDPTIYIRTPEKAAIQKATGGLLANTGQVITVAVTAAGLIIVFSTGFVIWSRRTLRIK